MTREVADVDVRNSLSAQDHKASHCCCPARTNNGSDPSLTDRNRRAGTTHSCFVSAPACSFTISYELSADSRIGSQPPEGRSCHSKACPHDQGVDPAVSISHEEVFSAGGNMDIAKVGQIISLLVSTTSIADLRPHGYRKGRPEKPPHSFNQVDRRSSTTPMRALLSRRRFITRVKADKLYSKHVVNDNSWQPQIAQERCCRIGHNQKYALNQISPMTMRTERES